MKKPKASKTLVAKEHFVGVPHAESNEDIADRRYKREYGFNKHSARSPLSHSEHEMNERFGSYGPVKKEQNNLEKGKPHGFMGRRLGSVYGKNILK